MYSANLDQKAVEGLLENLVDIKFCLGPAKKSNLQGVIALLICEVHDALQIIFEGQKLQM